MLRRHRVGQALAVISVCASTIAAAQTKKEYRFTVGPKASVSIINQYGGISVKPSGTAQVVVLATRHSDKAEIENTQNGDRIVLRTRLLDGANAENARVDYEVQLPADASISLHSVDGPLRAEDVSGDISMEGDVASVDVRDVAGVHVHVSSLNGPVTLTNIRNGHVEINSVGGDVNLDSVTGPFVEVTSAKGRIHYTGDFGTGGNYKLTSHTGDIEAIVPEEASFDVTARSVRGDVENDFPLTARQHTSLLPQRGRSFVGAAGKAASSVILRTFSGKIRLKKR
ncbi:MAG TPA: DUF4097 family beta strand repeat-containing protein [Terriglobales bacterium]|nr:DUF4097 family beta strand repeat-containing protein [Terriglobales bacterium]